MKSGDIKIIVDIRIDKSKEARDDARFSLENKRFRNAMNRIYYAIFYSVSALSAQDGFSTSKHKQLMGWFIKNYVKTEILTPEFSGIYKRAFDKRQESDYDDFSEVTGMQAEKYFDDMEKFIEKIFMIIDEKIQSR